VAFVAAGVVVLLLVAVVVHQFLPPRVLVMATGPEGSVYGELGPRYGEALAHAGIELRLLTTAGAVDNLARLRDPQSGVGVGFVHAGTARSGDSNELVSLGSLFFEPLWLFQRGRGSGVESHDLPGKRLSIGTEGSGSRELALRLLGLDGIDRSRFELLPLTPERACEQLATGAIDAAAMVTSFESAAVRRLIGDPDVTLASFPRADAWVALNPHLEKLMLPEGVGDMARNLPPKDVTLLATRATLVVRSDLHASLQYALLEAASGIHASAGVFNRASRFPAPEAADLPLSRHAAQFYKTGPPWLQRHMPPWLAVLAERFLLLLIPLAGLAYPLTRMLPALYQWGMRYRILRLYAGLKSLEIQLEREGAGGSEDVFRARLHELERRANHLRIPKTFSPLLYNFRVHLEFVRARLARLG
jgi:TRAP-type uncharacterized transport system substrate-binding protein